MNLKTLCKLAAYLALIVGLVSVGYIVYEQAALPQAPTPSRYYAIDAGKGPLLYGTLKEYRLNIVSHYTVFGSIVFIIAALSIGLNAGNKNKP